MHNLLFNIFLIVAVAGLFFSFMSLIFGGGAEDTDTGGLDADHIDISHDGDNGNNSGVSVASFFSLRTLMWFLTGFGAAGAAAINAGWGPWPSAGFGLLGGFSLVLFGVLLFTFVGKQQGNSAPKLRSLVGKTALVVTSIPEQGLGEIRVVNEFGTAVTLNAKSQDGAVCNGSSVEVVTVDANTATVKKAA